MREFALNFSKPIRIIDIATGTGDLALECLKLNPAKITGIDIAEQMLIKGREKIKQQNADHIIELINADSESIPFPEESFETATVAFGIRNFENLDKGLKEIQRVLVQGGELFILEFSKPRGILIKPFYHFYLSVICPVIGRIISGDPHAYGYLFRSINEFPFGEKMADIIKRAGFSKVSIHPLTLGVVTIYHAKK